MSIRERLDADMKAAMKAKETLRLETIRMARAAVKQREIDGRAEGAGEPTDADVQAVLRKLIKQRRESAGMYRDGGRPELADKEEAEAAILEAYLPEELGPERIEALVRETIAELGAAGPKQMGAVMKAVLAKCAGRADGKVVSEIVKKALAG